MEGEGVEFTCHVGGDPMPDILWKRTAGGGNMPLGRVHILEDRSLRLDDVTLEDEGEYSCVADNAVGAVTSSGTLTVFCKYNLDENIVIILIILIQYSASEVNNSSGSCFNRRRN